MSMDAFLYEMAVKGFVVFSNMVPELLVAKLRDEIAACQHECLAWAKKNGVDEGMDGAAHHVVGGGEGLNELLFLMLLDDYIKAYFEGEYILNSFGAVSNNPQGEKAYSHGLRYHRDVRTFSGGFRLMLNMIITLDDFTTANGATRIVPGTHRVAEKPTEDYFQRNAIQLIAPARSIVVFDSNLWHSASPNLTNMPRRALTLTFTRPFVKQQMDYPRMLGEDFPPNDRVRQILGYNARVPASYDEWYQPPDKRMYKPGQG